MATAQTVSGAKTFSGAGNSFTNATAVNLTNSNNGFSIGNRAGSHIAFDPSSIQSKASATASGILKINQLGGQIHIGTTQSRSSYNLFGISSPTFERVVNRASITVNHVGFALGGSGNMVLAPSSTGIDTPIALLVSHEVNINVTDHMMGFFRFTTAGATTPTRVGGITTTNTATAFATSSDYRLKTDLSDVDTDKLMELNPVEFEFYTSPGGRVDGFLAHEVQLIVPNAVVGEKDAVDSEGKPEYQSVDHSKLVPLLTAALQKAIRKIEDLTNRVMALEAKTA
jgi:hypothetical protein